MITYKSPTLHNTVIQELLRKNFSYMSSKSGRNFGHVCLLSADSSVRFSSLWLRWWERDDKIIFRVI